MSDNDYKILAKPFGNIILDADIYYRLYGVQKPRPYNMFKTISRLRPKGHALRLCCSFAKRRKYVIFSRLIFGLDTAGLVDHINRNQLDNRRANLRAVTARQNSLNRSKHKGADFFCVGQYKSGGRVYSCGKLRTKTGRLLTFTAPDTPNNRILCAFARDKFVLLNGYEEYAPLNFPCWKLEPFRSILIGEDLSAYKEKRHRRNARPCASANFVQR